MLLPLLSVSTMPDREVVRVVAAGEVDISTAQILADQLAELLESGWLDVIADLREVSFLDTSGLHVLLDAHESAIQRGAALSVAVEPGPVRRLLEITGSDRILSVIEPAAWALR
jgi:anti-sigma B factor antagonist